jgi:hypothetical protein
VNDNLLRSRCAPRAEPRIEKAQRRIVLRGRHRLERKTVARPRRVRPLIALIAHEWEAGARTLGAPKRIEQRSGGLDRPEAYAEFAVQCRDMGYPAFKVHGWGQAPIAQEIATVQAVRR